MEAMHITITGCCTQCNTTIRCTSSKKCGLCRDCLCAVCFGVFALFCIHCECMNLTDNRLRVIGFPPIARFCLCGASEFSRGFNALFIVSCFVPIRCLYVLLPLTCDCITWLASGGTSQHKRDCIMLLIVHNK